MTQITKLQLERAYSRVGKVATKTLLLNGTILDELWKAEVFVKCEQFQPIGAFKLRGAANFALQLGEKERNELFLTHSSGNHAQAVAYMAHRLGTKAVVVMPTNSSKVKKEAARKWGAEIVECEPTIEARIATVEALRKEKGGTIIPPFDHEWIIEGQSTCAMEIIANQSKLDMIAAPLGGGGLLSGTALAARYFAPGTKVIGCEPEGAADGYEGLRKRERISSYKAETIADGLRTTVGVLPYPIIRDNVEDIWLAGENEIVRWMHNIWREMKLVIEPTSAVAFAAMDGQREKIKGKRVAVIITGGNAEGN